ncbi:hypothetical protein BKA67DRAFT_665323 [Truncatella angustata]|uniref:Uncharacterized protein n=1 Tax=Truncatella angustata TaxID=152316 RepID=A0A9P8REE7_9PEZI|nr:uncharacterized protein BKA67DRAFT_665323 [Truncatella angustata]KAH6639938.1 hypothetical protein BKA67DRAFT_665323 [Truncatella angustata]
MLPLIDDAVIQANPGFGQLYDTLTSDILHPDGSTKNDKTTKQRDETRRELGEYRFKATRRHLLKHALATAAPPSSQPSAKHPTSSKSQSSRDAVPPPSELLDLLLLMPSFLDQGRTLRPADLELLLSSSPFSDFPVLLPQLTAILSSHITAQARGLARVLHPTTNPSFIHRAIPHILPTTQALLLTLSNNRANLTTKRLATTSNLVSHLNQHTEALCLLLQALEDKHGPAALSSSLRASEASLKAQLWATSMDLLLWETRAHLYPPEGQTALNNYQRHLRDAHMQLSNKLRTRELELGEYGVFISAEEGGLGIGRADELKERKLREMARVWKEMEHRLKDVNRDLKRLSRG